MKHMDSMATGDRPRHGVRGTEEGDIWHDCIGIVRKGRGGWSGVAWYRPYADPWGSICLPHFVEQLYHFVIDDKYDSHIQADPAQAGDSTLVERLEPLIP